MVSCSGRGGGSEGVGEGERGEEGWDGRHFGWGMGIGARMSEVEGGWENVESLDAARWRMER